MLRAEPNEEALKAMALIELDGHAIELICQGLDLGIKEANAESYELRAKYMEKLREDLQEKKKQFHDAWAKKLLAKYNIEKQTKKKRTRLGT
ncbi:hypothetical protein BHU72_14625 [Desulfuribacillus stibiiarsenatis]|uniref:Uncharacterized protein n=1 Tax=Desulfuribacillus stibiiarsenatis TaxID=1390249 RepID=A0A1E5L7E8_9FIRM|nr:hypothetical protein [Desulfuribacillus stibiiarsenatis]OEH86061.1 hypothetical protein BHU72_14625 [Desulfuribacillus stibiiarsenatis]